MYLYFILTHMCFDFLHGEKTLVVGGTNVMTHVKCMATERKLLVFLWTKVMNTYNTW
jgi:hypothetical protein